jgi:hypothetical protein
MNLKQSVEAVLLGLRMIVQKLSNFIPECMCFSRPDVNAEDITAS